MTEIEELKLDNRMWKETAAARGEYIEVLEAAIRSTPLEAMRKLADIVIEEWGESSSAEIVYEWLDKIVELPRGQRARIVEVAPTGGTLIIDAPPISKRIVVYGIVDAGESD